jgi:predicted metal-dependent phosphoesterase TrpH
MENNAITDEILCELHCHTAYSWDCEIPVKEVVRYAVAKGIAVLAITDHNEVDGAFEAQRLAPPELRIIVGEEISTQEGHLIALFITHKIEPHQPAEQTIAEIRKQGGIVLIPHAFDRLRGGFGEQNLLRLKDKIDFLEVFNARVLFPEDNVRALTFAKEQGMASYVGSDGHTGYEYGNALCGIADYTTKEEFVLALKKARFTTKLSGFTVYVLTEYVKWKKKVLRFFRP